jgi:hypothetical protein
MFGNEITQLLTSMANAIDDLAASENGDKLATGIAVLTRKIYTQLQRQGFNHEDCMTLTCAIISKGNSSS